jgi:hypothetical protein
MNRGEIFLFVPAGTGNFKKEGQVIFDKINSLCFSETAVLTTSF